MSPARPPPPPPPVDAALPAAAPPDTPALPNCNRCSEERTEKGSLAAYASTNQELDSLEQELSAARAGGTADGFLLYLLGLVLLDKQAKDEARAVLAASVAAYPCNWSAWRALQAACPDFAAAAATPLPAHFAARFFHAAVCVETQRNAEGLDALRALSDAFPASQPLLLAAAVAHNNLHNYDEAQGLFEDLLARDPHRVEGMDAYSNILYVKEDAPALAELAHRLADADRYRPESCAVVGNYYSLRGQHEKAVLYFRRALRLDPRYLPAWTLMGHEYVELKNPPAAIEAYRRAVDVAPRDYRAWYGLGQTYELVNMPHYALHYYRRAVALRPGDARMWNAMAHCYATPALGAAPEAIRCYRRALPNDREGVALRQLASLHAAAGERREAAGYHRLNLARVTAEGALAGQDAVDALTFLAQFAREEGDLEAAEGFYTRLLDYGGATQQLEEAKTSLREIRDAMAARGPAPRAGPSPGSDMGVTPPHW